MDLAEDAKKVIHQLNNKDTTVTLQQFQNAVNQVKENVVNANQATF